jgi:glycosyltransferase involved in cell wall biosynthesis
MTIRSIAGERPLVSVVVPLFNEQENLPALHARLTAVLGPMGVPYELVFVNDGSRDATAAMLADLAGTDGHVVAVHLSRNFGHQPAVCAGLDHARGRAVVVMDGDLQDPPEVLPEFLAAWRDGAEVVYAVRTRRKEGPLKRASYFLFYRILRRISDLEIPLDSGDFCLMDRRVVGALKALPERQRFVRGLRAFVGFRQVGLAYARAGRQAGEPKYTFRALLRLAADGVIGFSSLPLRAVSYLGLAGVAVAIALTLWAVLDAWRHDTTPRGWASIMVTVLFMGSLQLLSLGVIGEYLHRIFAEVKGRPTYIVREVQGRARDEEHNPFAGYRTARIEGGEEQSRDREEVFG